MVPTNESTEITAREVLAHCREYLSTIGIKSWPEKSTGLPKGALSGILYAYWKQLKPEKSTRRLILILPDDKQAESLYDELEFFQMSENQNFLRFLPGRGILPFCYAKADMDHEIHRVRSLMTLGSGKSFFLITSVEALALREPVSIKMESPITLSSGNSMTPAALIQSLQEMGYERTEIVEKPGEFAIKGGILDIYCPSYDYPLRIDYFGDEIEKITHFDIMSQRSIQEVRKTEIFSRHDLPLDSGKMKILSEEVKKQSKPGQHLPRFMESPHEWNGVWDLYPLILKTVPASELIPVPSEVITIDPESCYRKAKTAEEERNFLYEKNSDKFLLPPNALYLNSEELYPVIESTSHIYPVMKHSTDFMFSGDHALSFKGKVSSFAEWAGKQNSVPLYICAMSKANLERLRHILSGYQSQLANTSFLEAPLKTGYVLNTHTLITENDIFGKSLRKLKTSGMKVSEVIQNYTDLREGDFIVHINYGIGKFKNLKRMRVAGNERDFLELEFADNDKLYVPLEQLGLVHRYIGSTENPRLDFLGKKSSWEKTRERVSHELDSIAEELLVIYAERENRKGFSFPPDTSFQEEFEATFPYEETDHQIAAITDVKKDMESVKPMDRLICGDVGFGKTEVAIRAAFKCVMAGKQVMVLCPTTILAFQHFQNFSERFNGYPIQVDFISRFKTASQIKYSHTALTLGKIDILIGTHALLSKNVRPKNLGLLVVDEEQRFGVSHKEAIKKIRTNVDCLTLTATPIPRTMHMSLTGIRDLSIIETPPKNRRKIETYVLEENEEILGRAIKHEIQRNGQVYILHNKVKTIDAQVARFKSIYPNARYAILHGQMPEEQIEQVMLEFYKHEHDILVSTTIIESGIDIPNVNTLIVLNAQDFGLSQLYQIKGRVGRSDRQAVAYFVYPYNATLNEQAQKRLSTLQEYDDLGAGFKIAMRDLEIRGAGNLLGREQSGDIMEVGFELYAQMLQEKVAKLRDGKSPEPEFDCQLILPVDWYLPDEYVSDTRQKMEFYKKMNSANSLEELQNVAEDLQDRFGTMPLAVECMFAAENLRKLGNELRLERIEKTGNSFAMTASSQVKINPEKLVKLTMTDKRFRPDPDDLRKVMFQPLSADITGQLSELRRILEYFL